MHGAVRTLRAECGALRRPSTSPNTQTIIRELLHPRTWKPPDDRSFFLDAEQLNELCDVAERIFRDEPSVLQLQGGSVVFRGYGKGAPHARLAHSSHPGRHGFAQCGA